MDRNQTKIYKRGSLGQTCEKVQGSNGHGPDGSRCSGSRHQRELQRNMNPTDRSVMMGETGEGRGTGTRPNEEKPHNRPKPG